MSEKPDSAAPRSIFERGASNGLWMGLYFIILFFAMIGSIRFGFLNLVVILMGLTTPYLIYRQLRQTHVDAHGMETTSAIWMQGIMTFICGSIILCAGSYVYLRWVYPDFMLDSCMQILQTYKENPDLPKDTLFSMAQAVVDKPKLIRPNDIAMAYLWMGSFSGSVLSLILALIVKRISIKQ